MLGWWLAGATLPVPQLLRGSMEPIAVELLLASAYAPLVAYALPEPVLRVEYAARRSLAGPDVLALAALFVPVLLVGAVATLAGDVEVAILGVRNTTGLVGLALLVRALAGDTAAAGVPVGYVVVAALLGGQLRGSVHWWAVFRSRPDTRTLLAGLVLLVAGAWLFHRQGRRRAAGRA